MLRSFRALARRHWNSLGALVALAVTVGWVDPSFGQGGGAQGTAGVLVDANGVLRTRVESDPTGELTKRQAASAKASLDQKLQQKSALRKISLQRLEKAVAEHTAKGYQPTEEMKFLAGLTRVTNVFFYPDSGDIVIAGPAEPWMQDLTGRTVGMNTGRSTVELQDLVVALRAFAPGGKGTQSIGCSIDATKEGLARMQQFLARIGSQAEPTAEFTQTVVDGLRTSLGLQEVSIYGISPDTHFAQVLVEADYRMKLIGIGLEIPPVKIVSYVDRADPSSVARNAMQRWWFVPNYDCVRVSEDELAMELVGNGVKLLGEDEVVGADGQRRQAASQGNLASLAFVTGFTTNYERLAAKVPVYAQLRNLIDLSVAAAYIHQHDYYGRSSWKMDYFGDEKKFSVRTYPAPLKVETAVASRWKGTRLMTPVGGGVTINPREALQATRLLSDEKGKVKQLRDGIRVEGLSANQWWWD